MRKTTGSLDLIEIEATENQTVRAFAVKYRLKLRTDLDETKIIPGRDGHLYEHDLGRLGLMYMPVKAKTAEMWGNRRRACVAAVMELHQDGDREGSVLFDPANPEQAKLAISTAGVKRRRIMSDAQKKVLSRARTLLPVKAQVSHDRAIVSTSPQEAL
jgi:hypothetical protein